MTLLASAVQGYIGDETKRVVLDNPVGHLKTCAPDYPYGQ